MKKKNKNLGFTLIEVLVVIAIIGILAAIALVSFTGAQRQARDANRKSDLRMYETALVQYASKNKGKYPSYTGGVDLPGLCNTLDLSNCPTDTDDTYRYISNGATNGTATATEYVIWSTLESTNNPEDTWVICSGGAVGTYYGTPGSFNCPELNVPAPPSQPPAETLPPTSGTPTATPIGSTPIPGGCYSACSSYVLCESPLVCTRIASGNYICLNPSCPTDNDCHCIIVETPTPTPPIGTNPPACIPGGWGCSTEKDAVPCCAGYECSAGRCVIVDVQ